MFGKPKIRFRDYEKYPSCIMNACAFRDAYNDEPDGAFFALADEHDMTNALIEMAEWESAHTESD